MAGKNDITGDELKSKPLSEEGKKNWDIIFPHKKREPYIPPTLPPEVQAEFDKLAKKYYN